jgi:WD40 repeat protein
VVQTLTLDADAWGWGDASPDGRSYAVSLHHRGPTHLERLELPAVAGGAPEQPAVVRWSAPLPSLAYVSWSPDGSTIAAATLAGPILLYDAETGALLARLRGHTPFSLAAVFVDNGAALASVGGDGDVRIWDRADLRTEDPG